MSFDRPTLAELIARIKADINARLETADATLRRTLLGILATVEAGGVHGLYGYLDWIADQVMPDTADTEQLERWASIWGKQRKSASTASGTATVAGTDGSVIPADTVWTRADDVDYLVTADATVADGTAVLAIEAADAGEDGNADADTRLSLTMAISGVESTAVVVSLTGGADAESDEDLRLRVLTRIREAPHGGAAADYTAWALEVSGVTRAWVYPRELGAGTVTVRIMTDDTTEDGIPDDATVAAVQSYIDNVRPVTAEVTVVAPVPTALDLTIGLSPNTAAVRAAVEEELADLLLREAEPGVTILLSHLQEAISIATGETDHVLTSPTADVEYATGELPVLGLITWSTLA